MNGKNKCKLLKEIRKQIAAENDIAYVTSECKYKGDCTGTCPKCEAELRYLEEQLSLRRRAGKAVAISGIAATIMMTASGCDFSETVTLTSDMGDFALQAESTESSSTDGTSAESEESSVTIMGKVTAESDDYGKEITSEEPESLFVMGEFPDISE